MKPLRVPGDPARAIKDYLAAVLPGLIDGDGPTVGLNLPDDWEPASPPHLLVADDGGPTAWPVTTTPRIRLTAWAAGRTVARGVCGIALGVVLSHRIPGVATAGDPSALLEARDDNNDGLMASATVRVQARTLAV